MSTVSPSAARNSTKWLTPSAAALRLACSTSVGFKSMPTPRTPNFFGRLNDDRPITASQIVKNVVFPDFGELEHPLNNQHRRRHKRDGVLRPRHRRDEKKPYE